MLPLSHGKFTMSRGFANCKSSHTNFNETIMQKQSCLYYICTATNQWEKLAINLKSEARAVSWLHYLLELNMCYKLVINDTVIYLAS